MSKSKKNKAVALRYNADEDIAPVVIASGYGTVADRIIDIAEQRGSRYSVTTARRPCSVCWRWVPRSRKNCIR